jgi:predicted nucleic acid-binding Zn ribbon protein
LVQKLQRIDREGLFLADDTDGAAGQDLLDLRTVFLRYAEQVGDRPGGVAGSMATPAPADVRSCVVSAFPTADTSQ